MFAVIHNGSVAVKDKYGNVYPGVNFKRDGDFMACDILPSFKRLPVLKRYIPVLEHGKQYIVELRNGFIVAEFDADEFAFFIGASWSVNEVKGFAPIPQMIEI